MAKQTSDAQQLTTTVSGRIEELFGYQRGGYHPVLLGDKYDNGRYEIVHKLRYTEAETIWLGLDHETLEIVTLRVLTYGASTWLIGEPQKRARFYTWNYLDGKHMRQLHRASGNRMFTIYGPNGVHFCVVQKTAGHNLMRSMEVSVSHRFQVNVARAIVAQLLLGVKAIHLLGVTHGDLQTRKIVFKKPVFHTKGTELKDLYRRIGTPLKFPVKGVDGGPIGSNAPEYCVPTARTVFPSHMVSDPRIIITEFGRQTPRNGEWKWDSDMSYSAPELLFNDRPAGEPGQPADVWSLGCMICEILGETSLFPRFIQNRDEMISELVIALGMPPKRWWEQWSRRSEYFYENGTLRVNLHRLCMRKLPTLPEKVWYLGWGYLSSADEIEALLELVQGMLMYLPEERMTATQALHSRWMSKWGWAAMQEMSLINPRNGPPVFTEDMNALPGIRQSIEV